MKALEWTTQCGIEQPLIADTRKATEAGQKLPLNRQNDPAF